MSLQPDLTPRRRTTALLRGRGLTEGRAALADLSTRYLQLRPSALPDLSLAGGAAGAALVHAALHPVFPAAGHLARAERRLTQAVEQLGRGRVDPGLHAGVAGVGWVIAHLVGPPAEGGEDLCAPIDRALAVVLDRAPWTGPFDVINGLAGIGVYALERAPHPAAGPLVARVVRRLAETVKPQATGATWWSNPAWLPRSARRAHHPDWNLGVAHGVAGVIAFLGRAVAAAVDAPTTATARTLLEGAVAWLLSQELPTGAAGCFPWAVAPGIPRAPARVAWCAGDPGIAAALHVAARSAGEPGWAQEATRIGLRAALRGVADAGVVDVGLCHGAAGNAHVFHRLHRATGDDRFADAARRWFARALAMRAPGRGVAGFRAYDPDPRGVLGWRSAPGFLTGAAGVALALVAATTDAEPRWDRALLLS